MGSNAASSFVTFTLVKFDSKSCLRWPMQVRKARHYCGLNPAKVRKCKHCLIDSMVPKKKNQVINNTCCEQRCCIQPIDIGLFRLKTKPKTIIGFGLLISWPLNKSHTTDVWVFLDNLMFCSDIKMGVP